MHISLVEKAIVGALVADGNTASKQLIGEINSEMFESIMLAEMFSELMRQAAINSKTDVLLLISNLSKYFSESEIRIMAAECASAIVHIDNLKMYIAQMQQDNKVRMLKKIATSLALGDINSDSVDEKILAATEQLGSLNASRQGKELNKLGDISIKHYQSMFEEKELKDAITTGYKSIDDIQQFIFPGNLVVLAARPGVGKSVMAQNIAINIAETGKKVALYSLEMSEQEVFYRITANKAHVNLGIIQGKDVGGRAGEIARAVGSLYKTPLYINDQGYQTVESIRAEVQLKGIDVVIIDYLQLLSTIKRYQSTNDKVSDMTRGLKIMAQDLGVVVILLSQLNRISEYDMPSLMNLRGSGSIEQDANVVWFMWLNREKADGESNQEIAFRVSKNRNGRLGSCVFDFYGGVMKFNETDKKANEKSGKRKDAWD